MSSASSTSKPSLYETNQEGEKWTPSFYYFNPRPSLDAHEHDEEDEEILVDYHPSFHELHTALRHYREMADGIVKKLSMAHEVASRTEQLLFPNHDPGVLCKEDGKMRARTPSFLSCELGQKITKSARLLEQNMIVLEELLKPFPVTVGLSPLRTVPYFLDSSTCSRDETIPTTTPQNSQFTFPPPHGKLGQHATESDLSMQSLARYIPPYKANGSNANEGEEEPYDSASHIITHISRDWTVEGLSIRNDTYDWIVDQLWSHHYKQIEVENLQLDSTCSQHSPLSPVLVPGAGMARLAFDIAFAYSKIDGTKMYPFAVEGVDNSIVMAGAAYHLLQHCSKYEQDTDPLKIHPIVSDPFINEVDTQRRWGSAMFPEDDVLDKLHRANMQQSSHRPSLSYVIADFVRVYASPSKHAAFGSIATCFFIDTATNIYEYILTIRNLLQTGGVWLNVGPVQWHQNAQLQPSINELKDIILLAGFNIIQWKMSEKIVAYRHPDDIQVGTRVEAYRPLKFVAVLKADEHAVVKEGKTDTDLLSSTEKLRQVTGRQTMRPR